MPLLKTLDTDYDTQKKETTEIVNVTISVVVGCFSFIFLVWLLCNCNWLKSLTDPGLTG